MLCSMFFTDVLVYFFVCLSFHLIFHIFFLFSRTVDRLWSITEDLNILYKENWTRLAAQEVQQFQVSNIKCLSVYMRVRVCVFSFCLYTINLTFSPS